MQIATFGAGCFWGIEVAFRKLDGVSDAVVGYTGGQTCDPTYPDVCTGRTGHAEVVRVTYDPERIDYGALLDLFWNAHDPTQLNRQGPDFGTQYRSAIFFHDADQEAAALASKAALESSGCHARPVVTTIEPAPEFYRAEEYHQSYLAKRGQDSCGI
ncbi:MAG: peptide-methionine (S)-S-oxide reductase MsrA [Planctomycetota bacterium]